MKATTGHHQKQGCLQKQCSRPQHRGRPTAAETRGTSQHQQQKVGPQQQGCHKLANNTTSISRQKGDPQKQGCHKLANNSAGISRDENSSIWKPTVYEFCGNSPKCHQNGEKIVKKDINRVKVSHFCPIDGTVVAPFA